MSLNIVVTGPESTGKTQLAVILSEKLGLPLITEVAREYLLDRLGGYLPSDLLTISELQYREEAVKHDDNGFVADTDHQVLSIWWQEKYGPLPRRLTELYRTQGERFYLLCFPDLPWQPDPLRENERDRQRLFDIYVEDLESRNLPYAVVKGAGEKRTLSAIQAITVYKESSICCASEN